MVSALHVNSLLLEGASKEQNHTEEFMTHLVWGSSLSGRDLNWNRRFLIKIGIPNNLPSTQTGNSRWETASLPTPHLPETRIKRSLVLVWQCVTSHFMLLLGTLLNSMVQTQERGRWKCCLTDVTGIFENPGAENQSVVQDQCARHRWPLVHHCLHQPSPRLVPPASA